MGEGWGQLMHFDSYIESLKVSWFRKKNYSQNMNYGILSILLDLDLII